MEKGMEFKKGILSADGARKLGVPHLAQCQVDYEPKYYQELDRHAAGEIYYQGTRLGALMSFGYDGIIPCEEIAKFIQDFFAWTYLPYQGRGTCDKEAFMNWQCCPFHRQGMQELEQFQQIARAIESQFPTFYQREQHPSVLSQAWFLRLSEVSGVPLPDRKMATWLEER